MANATTDNTSNTEVKKRKPSKESLLKKELKSVKKDLDKIDKQIEAFEAMKKEEETWTKAKAALSEKLEVIKQKLMKELDLV